MSLYREYIAAYSLTSGQGSKGVGAILELPDGAWKDKISNNKLGAMSWYFDLHAESWHKHYKKIYGKLIANGLKIVNCTYKSKTWALATCSSQSSGNIFARVYRKRPDTDLYEWEAHKDVKGRRGPDLEKFGKETTDLSNQCVAVEVSSIELTKNLRSLKSSMTTLMSKISITH